jgi:endonuclease/exonuclease/phosphatase family metal-dependent hydrolase
MRFASLLFCLILTPAAAEAPPGLDEMRRAGAIVQAFSGPSIRVLCWNIERGERFDEVAAALAAHPADLLLLQEVDRNARRSGNRDLAAEFARRLGLESAFAAEFLELGQRVNGRPAFHGQATLTRLPVTRARFLRHRQRHDSWRPKPWLPDWAIFQPREGGRLALITEHQSPAGLLVAYNLHLESRGPEALRLSQMREVLDDIRQYPPEATILIAGDLNTKKADSPVLQAPRDAGFTAVLGGEITTKRGQPLDWIFVRGPWSPSDGRIHSEIRAADHYPLTVTLTPRDPATRDTPPRPN